MDSSTDADLEELMKQFGTIPKIYLAKEKTTNACKGFVRVRYKARQDSARAVKLLNHHDFNHFRVILKIE
uniref:RRM domain-containing protein n=1 Tax=Trichogramma kaykai TaxID=54128 RepID=A0ABD2W4Y0_9HYME